MNTLDLMAASVHLGADSVTMSGKKFAALIAVAQAAKDVLTRWDSPTWKNAESTAETMAILRARLATLKENGNG